MPGRLQTPGSTYLAPGETDPRKITDSINFANQQAFAPFSKIAQGTDSTDDFNSTTYTAITGLSVSLVVPVQSRAIIHVVIRLSATTLVTGESLSFRLYRDGSAITGTTHLWEPSSTDERDVVSFFWMDEDLVPETEYTYEVYCRVSPRTTSVYRVVGTRSSLLVTTEARQRI